MLLVFSACDKQVSYDFEVRCHVDPSFSRDKAALWIIDNDYGKRIMLASQENSNGRFSLKGQIDRPTLAFLKFNNDTTPFYFVLEPTLISITINPENVIISGGEENREYARFIRQYKDISDKITSNNRRYVRLVCDSTLTREQERTLALRDSTLSDSLQMLVISGIRHDGPISTIITQRYIHILDSAHISHLHP